MANRLSIFITGMPFWGKTCDFSPIIKQLDWETKIMAWDAELKIPSDLKDKQVSVIGHSFGGDRAVKVSQILGDYCDKLLLLDPVRPEWFSLKPWRGFKAFEIPKNVSTALCIRRKAPIIPPSRFIANPSDLYKNLEIKGDHGNYPALPDVIEQSLKFLKGE